MLRHDNGDEERRISKKSKSLNATTRSAIKLPTAFVSIYVAVGNALVFIPLLIYQFAATFIASRRIVPSTQPDLPVAPNFFLAAKGPDGSLAVVERQACYDGALGGIRSL
ncbi:hypothetical protein F4808DRAFT_466292 [Astrocystis sublimbata]|nr:hypothetical protein F4808DRAFT_466292 [Astrocystis sublimbata]